MSRWPGRAATAGRQGRRRRQQLRRLVRLTQRPGASAGGRLGGRRPRQGLAGTRPGAPASETSAPGRQVARWSGRTARGHAAGPWHAWIRPADVARPNARPSRRQGVEVTAVVGVRQGTGAALRGQLASTGSASPHWASAASSWLAQFPQQRHRHNLADRDRYRAHLGKKRCGSSEPSPQADGWARASGDQRHGRTRSPPRPPREGTSVGLQVAGVPNRGG